MKKILLLFFIITISIISPSVDAQTLDISTYFGQDIEYKNFESIGLLLLDSLGKEHTIVLYRNSYFEKIINDFPNGNITVEAAVVRKDYYNKYPIDVKIEGEEPTKITLYVSKNETPTTTTTKKVEENKEITTTKKQKKNSKKKSIVFTIFFSLLGIIVLVTVMFLSRKIYLSNK